MTALVAAISLRMRLVGVEAVGGFVEDQHFRVVQDRLRETDAHTVTLGERVDALGGDFLEATEGQRAADALGRVGEAAEVGGEAEEFTYGHLTVGGSAFRRVAEVLLGADGLVGDVEAGDVRGAGVGAEVTGEHLHRGGFPGPVGSEKADDLAAVDGEGDVTHGAERAVGLRQVMG
jgi:hypothetical protein